MWNFILNSDKFVRIACQYHRVRRKSQDNHIPWNMTRALLHKTEKGLRRAFFLEWQCRSIVTATIDSPRLRGIRWQEHWRRSKQKEVEECCQKVDKLGINFQVSHKSLYPAGLAFLKHCYRWPTHKVCCQVQKAFMSSILSFRIQSIYDNWYRK